MSSDHAGTGSRSDFALARDSQVNELRHVDPQPLQHSIQRDLHDLPHRAPSLPLFPPSASVSLVSFPSRPSFSTLLSCCSPLSFAPPLSFPSNTMRALNPNRKERAHTGILRDSGMKTLRSITCRGKMVNAEKAASRPRASKREIVRFERYFQRAKTHRSPEGQGVHILRDCGVDNASLREYSALRLGLCGSFNHLQHAQSVCSERFHV